MFALEILQVFITSMASITVLFLLTKLMGKQQVSELSMFDYITGISIGSIAAEMATELENPLHSLIAMVVYAVSALCVSLITNRWIKSRRLLSGSPAILMNNGKIYRENMKREHMDINELIMKCRNQGYFDLSTVQTVIMESNGALSILPVSTERPATPNDLGLSPQQEIMQIPVIMEGRICEENLKHEGKDKIWLKKELDRQGYSSEKDIMLAMCSGDTLNVFPIK